MKMLPAIHLMFMVPITLVFGGCCLPGTYCPGEYINRLQNATVTPMSGVEIRWTVKGEEVLQQAGYLPSCVEGCFGANFDLSPQPIPDKVMARWKTQDGNEHRRTVEVAMHVPDVEHFAGTIVFKFYDDDVSIVAIPHWLERRNSRLGKTTVP